MWCDAPRLDLQARQVRSFMQLIFRASARTTPVVLSSPHSGRLYPERLLERTALGIHQLRPLDDGPVDLLLEPALPHAAGLFASHLPRAWIDLNRRVVELDPDGVDGSLPWRLERTAKVRAGLGLVPTRVGERDIYEGRLDAASIVERVATSYRPFHEALATEIDRLRRDFGIAVLLDCHSMPKASVMQLGGKAEIVIGDRHGTSASPWITGWLVRRLREKGLAVAVNRPFAGGYITEAFGRPAEGLHALQLEVRRDLFLDEPTYRLHRGAPVLSRTLAGVVEGLGHEALRRAGRAAAA